MLIKRVCPFTREVKEVEISVTPEQIHNWECGMLIQNAMPNISASEREFILTGITDDVWNSTFDI